MMKKLLVALMIGLMSLAVGGHASAQAGADAVGIAAEPALYCSAGKYCIYEDYNFEQGACKFDGNESNYALRYGQRPNGAGIGCNEIASSYVNNGNPDPHDDVFSYRHPNNPYDRLWFVPRGEWHAWVEDSYCMAKPCNDQASGHGWV